MIIDAKDKFLSRSLLSLSAIELYDCYLNLVKDNPQRICARSILYLKRFVQNNPYECLRIIRKNEHQYLSMNPWGDEYIYLLSLIAAFYLDNDHKAYGLNWAVKALDMIDCFMPTLSKGTRNDILYNMSAQAMVCAYPKDFHQYVYDNFFLEWELKLYKLHSYSLFSNDN